MLRCELSSQSSTRSWCYDVNFLLGSLHALDATLWTFFSEFYTLLMLRCELSSWKFTRSWCYVVNFLLGSFTCSWCYVVNFLLKIPKHLCLNSADCWSRIERQWENERGARMVPIGPTFTTWCKRKMMMMMMVMMMMMIMMMMMMMMKRVKTVMAVMAMRHKRWMESLVAGKKNTIFCSQLQWFLSWQYFPQWNYAWNMWNQRLSIKRIGIAGFKQHWIIENPSFHHGQIRAVDQVVCASFVVQSSSGT